MEKLPHQEYRDNLAKNLKEIRNDSKSENPRQDAQEYFKTQKETEEYKDALELHKEDIDKIVQNKSVEQKIKNTLILKADQLIAMKLLEKGASLYREAGLDPKEKLLENIDIEKDPGLAIRAYEIAGIKMPEDIYLRSVEVIEKHIIDDIVSRKGTDPNIKPTQETKKRIDWVTNEYKRLGYENKIIEFAEALLSDQIFDKETGLVLLANMGQTKRLISFGEMFASKGNKTAMIKAYELAGVEMPKEKIIECADRYLERHEAEHQNDHGFYAYIEMILDMYEKAVPEANDRLIKIGDRLIKEGRFRQAKDAYNRAGTEIPKEKIIECADKLRFQGLHGHGDFAFDCMKLYKLAGDKEKLLEAAEEFFVKGNYESVIKILKDSEIEISKETLISWVDKTNNIIQIIGAYRFLNVEITKEKLIEYGDFMFNRGKTNPERRRKWTVNNPYNNPNPIYDFETAMESYASAGAKEKMIEVADAYLVFHSPDIALEWYRKIKEL